MIFTAYYHGVPVWTWDGPRERVPNLQLDVGWYIIGWIEREVTR